MKNNLISKIPLININRCLQETSADVLNIYDDPNRWCKLDNNKFHFTVNNRNKKDILFLAIDKCCLNNSFVGKRCDFGVIVNNNAIILIEIKDTINRRRKNRAVEQLENTIVHFQSLSLLDNINSKTAVISWKYIPSRPAASSSIMSARLRFLNNYNFDLLEGNKISV